MAPILYITPSSPYVRAVLMTAKAIELELTLITVNPARGVNLPPEVLKVNPAQALPTLVDDDGFIVWDSHVIITYLVSKYGKDDRLYPDQPRARAIVDQLLFFEVTVVAPRLRKLITSIFRHNKKSLSFGDVAFATNTYSFMDTLLEYKIWLANNLSVADYSFIALISNFHALCPIDISEYPNLARWYDHCQHLPEYAENARGLALFRMHMSHRMSPSFVPQ